MRTRTLGRPEGAVEREARLPTTGAFLALGDAAYARATVGGTAGPFDVGVTLVRWPF